MFFTGADKLPVIVKRSAIALLIGVEAEHFRPAFNLFVPIEKLVPGPRPRTHVRELVGTCGLQDDGSCVLLLRNPNLVHIMTGGTGSDKDRTLKRETKE